MVFGFFTVLFVYIWKISRPLLPNNKKIKESVNYQASSEPYETKDREWESGGDCWHGERRCSLGVTVFFKRLDKQLDCWSEFQLFERIFVRCTE